MQRSKLFLGTTTALLAVAGVAATKHYGPLIPRYYITIHGTYCQTVTTVCTKTVGNLHCTYTVTQQLTVTYSIFTKGPSGPKTSSNCLTYLQYLAEH